MTFGKLKLGEHIGSSIKSNLTLLNSITDELELSVATRDIYHLAFVARLSLLVFKLGPLRNKASRSLPISLSL